VSACLFCQIAEGKLSARIVYEDAHVVAFEDINPQAPVHLLVIPRRHIPSTAELAEADQELMGRLLWVASRLAREREAASRGYRLVLNCGPDAGQSVFHVHVHLLAGRHLGWPPG